MSRLFLLYILSTILYSCEKKEEQIPPQIIFTSPIEGQNFQSGDTIKVSALLKDDKKIKTASLFLVETSTKLTKGTIQNFIINSKEFILTNSFILPTNSLESSNYYFEIKADDGELQSSEFLSIHINQPERRKMGWLLIRDNGVNSTLFKLDSIGKPLIKILDLPYLYKSFALNMPYQQLWLLPERKGNLLTIDLDQTVTVNKIIAPSTQFEDAFSTIFYDRGLTFVGENNGLLQAYNYQFSDVFTYRSTLNYRVKLLDANELYLMVIEQGVDFFKSRIRMLYRNSGGLYNNNVISKNIVEVKLLSAQNAYLLCDYNNVLEIFNYDINRGAYTSLLKFPLSAGERFIRFQKGERDDCFLVTNQNIFQFVPPNRLNRIVTAAIVDAKFDSVTNEIIALANDSLIIWDGRTFYRKQGMPIFGKYKAVIPWYSR